MASPDYYWNAVHGINELLAQHASHAGSGQQPMTEYLLLAGAKSCAVLGELLGEPGLIKELDDSAGKELPAKGYTNAIRAANAERLQKLGFKNGALSAMNLVERAHALMLSSKGNSAASRDEALKALGTLKATVCQTTEEARALFNEYLEAQAKLDQAGAPAVGDKQARLQRTHQQNQQQSRLGKLGNYAGKLLGHVANACTVIAFALALGSSAGDTKGAPPVQDKPPIVQRVEVEKPSLPYREDTPEIFPDGLFRFGLPKGPWDPGQPPTP
jgi:hypothetical protein